MRYGRWCKEGQTVSDLHIGVAGAGAVGAHYGLALLRAGLLVRFLARGAHLQAMRRNGLRHVSAGRVRTVRVDCSGDPASLAGCDVLLIACKTTQLDGMIEALRPYVGRALLVSVQNGVEAPARLARAFPQAPVVAASAFIGVRIEPPGTVVHTAAGHIRLAPWRGDVDRIMHCLCEVWRSAGVDARALTDARRMLWEKMLWNCGFNAITALTRRYARDIAEDAPDQVTAVMREAWAVARAEGVMLEEGVIARHIEATLHAGEVKTSMWQDVEHHREVEIDAMNGCICRLAERHGIDVPRNRLLTMLIQALSGRRP